MTKAKAETVGRPRSGWRIGRLVRKAVRLAAIQQDTTQEELVERILADHLASGGFLPAPRDLIASPRTPRPAAR